MPSMLVEDSEIYDLAKEVYEKGKIKEVKELGKERKDKYAELSKDQIRNLNSRLGQKFVDNTIEQIELGNISKVKEVFLNMKDNIKLKSIKNLKDCSTSGERRAFVEASKKAPIKTFLFGAKVEVIDKRNKKQTIKQQRNKVNIEKVDLISPVPNNEYSKQDLENEIEIQE